jgi:hypothetical protein
MAQPISRTAIRPAKDEWGVYDPEQAGLAALYARLDNKKDPKAAAAAKPADSSTVAHGAKVERKDQPVKPTLRK